MIDETQKALGVMGLTYGNFTTERLMAYYENLKDLPGPLVSRAIGSLIRTSKFAPSVAEIREETIAITRAMVGAEPAGASKAWQDVQEAISRVGGYRTPTFDDPITEEAVRRYGWLELCMTSIDKVEVARAQFTRFYEAVAAEQRTKQRTAQALGKVPGRETAALGEGKGETA